MGGGTKTKMNNRSTQAAFARLAMQLSPHKEEIQKEIEGGKNATDFARKYNVSIFTMRKLLEVIGVKTVHGGAGNLKTFHMNVVIVLSRVAHAAGVNYDEIKPYLK